MWPSTLKVHTLRPVHAHAIGLHLLALNADDRYNRFGVAISDAALRDWVQRLDWRVQPWWGIWGGSDMGLLAVLQLSKTRQSAVYELAMSVHPLVRCEGLGTRLLTTVIQQSPEVRKLICHHGHVAVRKMIHRMGWTCQTFTGEGWWEFQDEHATEPRCRAANPTSASPSVSAHV